MEALPDDELELLAWNTRDNADSRLRGWWAGAREDQLPPVHRAWTYWFVIAGRGFGKTRMGAEYIRSQADAGLAGRIGLIGKDPGEVRDVMIEGESGILACSPTRSYPNAHRKFRPRYEPSKKRVTWPNGVVASVYSSEQFDELRGPQHHLVWSDEPAKYRYLAQTIDNMLFGLRLGVNPRAVFTTTPRPIPALRTLMADPLAVVTHGTTYDNLANLSPAYQSIIRKYEGTRLGRQELLAEMLLDVPGALWSSTLIGEHRVLNHPDLARVVVGVDPTASEEGAETGIIVVGRAQRSDHGFVLADRTTQGKPKVWARAVIDAYREYGADCIIAEVNNGGDMVEAVLHAVDPTVNVLKVHASRGKITRAEPISALYERGLIHHVGMFPELEDQMTTYEPLTAKVSPDRMDALVWACTELYGTALIDFNDAVVEARPAEQQYDRTGAAHAVPESPWLSNGAM